MYRKLSREKTSHFKTDIRNNIIIRNLRYDEREKYNAEITKNLVQTLFRDGLALLDINIKSVCKKNGTDKGPGMIIVELNDMNQKKEIFKKKKELKKSKYFSKVTLLKEIGKDKELIFVGNKLVQKKPKDRLRFGIWNCRGWSLKENDNSQFRKLVLQNSDCDIFAVCETCLRGNEEHKINGYKWFGNNRETTHVNAVKGSGGVGFFVKSEICNKFEITLLDKCVKDILWIQIKSKTSNVSLCVAVCYLLPNESKRPNDKLSFFENLLQQVYCNLNNGYTIICGDFNARCGSNNDYIEGVDDIIPRSVIDHCENLNGDLFIEFLSDINFAMLNGRIGCNDFTYISPQGKSVVDYICVPYE
ncbi:unnamed protein product [Mytilus coruscus]|uniref:Endonuclease/exonuclease/phosphatase domain-containing protein n=1 Tax=Mytilus coruscus TaxID=42192 RepID=A0A6J8D9X5_MYTCO|nr:unnamed protein product [Mytilus coruscus]